MGITAGTLRKPVTRHSRSLAERVLSIVLIGAACLLGSTLCFGQEEQRAEETPVRSSSPATTLSSQATSEAQKPAGPSEANTQSENKKKRDPRRAFVIAPLPISSPALGSGIVPVVGYIFPFSTKDKVSPPSVVGAAGLVTNNGSRAFAVAGKFYFKQDLYQFTAGFAHGNLNYDLYGSGIQSDAKLPLQQTGQMFFAEFLRRIGWKFFLGPQLLAGKSLLTISPNNGSAVPIPPGLGLDTTLTALGIRLTRDTSANRFYPTNGTFFSFTSDFFSQGLGSKYSFQTYRTTFNKYWSLGDKEVLAYNAYFCATGGDPPFYGNCVYGTNNELRGYTAGQYFTRYMVATQIEYRLILPKRFGLVVFGGMGEVIPGQNQVYGSQNFLPGGGGGLRFQLSKQHHVNLRADIAQGKNGHTFAVGIGEAF
jgi:hypothetical protein